MKNNNDIMKKKKNEDYLNIDGDRIGDLLEKYNDTLNNIQFLLNENRQAMYDLLKKLNEYNEKVL